MRYQHTLGFQVLLQKAVRTKKASAVSEVERTRRTAYSWQTLAELLGTPPVRPDVSVAALKSMLIRFDQTILREHLVQRGRLFMDSGTAAVLWERLKPEIGQLLDTQPAEGSGLFGHELIGSALSWNYRTSNEEFGRWIKSGLHGKFFGYKPSFRKMGHVIKSEFDIEPSSDEWFSIRERQMSTLEVSGGTARETSSGYGIVKSDRLVMFLKEHAALQPRLFCFHRCLPPQSTSKDQQEGQITHLLGWVLESDTNFTNGLYPFKVGLVSERTDRQLWEELNNGDDNLSYQPERQIENVPYTELARKPYTKPEHVKRIQSVLLDKTVLDWIDDDIRDILKEEWSHI